MPLISFAKGRAPIEVSYGANLMDSLLDAGLPVASSCGGDAVCAKCRVDIVSGRENLSPENEEEAFLRERFEIPRRERISCQVEVRGDVTVDTAYW